MLFYSGHLLSPHRTAAASEKHSACLKKVLALYKNTDTITENRYIIIGVPTI